MTLQTQKLRLGEQLIQRGLISKDQLHIALKEQLKHSRPLGQSLVSLNFISETKLHDALGNILGKESIDLTKVVPQMEALALIPKSLSIQFNIIPVSLNDTENRLSIAIADIYNLRVLDQLHTHTGKHIKLLPLLCGASEISHAIDQFYGVELSIDGILYEMENGKIEISDHDYSHLNAQQQTYRQPLVRLVDAILSDAVKRGASDIHLEPESAFLRIRFRIDGVLQQVRCLHIDYWLAIVVRLKVMSNMNIAETRAPQDGRINLNIRGHQIDFRMSSQPTTHGENIVLRVLDRNKGIVAVDKLGLEDDALSMLKLMMARPSGLILISGPTGSGKTTTLYSMLDFLRSVKVNIMTLEDPVEYPMEMIRQTSINEVIRMDFANGIRSLMRQDPDIILIGEIRDKDTAEMAIRAAMTGHQVYSTVHTNSAIGTLPRLADLGIKPEIIAGNIIGVISQRLIRKLCRHCKTAHNALTSEKILLGINSSESIQIFNARGCDQCEYTGYKGRFAILEILKITAELDEMIAQHATIGKFKKHLQDNNFKTLNDDAIRNVRNGITSIDEISRVIDLTEQL